MAVQDQATSADYQRAQESWRAANVSPLWENREAHRLGDEAIEKPYIWRWSEMQPLIANALAMQSTAVAERRVLSLVSPHSPEVKRQAGTTLNLNGGLQILKPGESARPHRHSMNALRFVMSGEGAVTVVDGKECEMAESDLVTTPAWCWHEHIHRGSEPIVWLDVLDASLHRYLGTDRFQPGPPNEMPDLPADAAFSGSGLVPDTGAWKHNYSPVFRYGWKQASAALSLAPVSRDGSKRIRYTNPVDGGPVMFSLDCWMIEIAGGTQTIGFRTSANAIACIVDGYGHSKIGESRFDWVARDVFSLPRNNWISHRAESEKARIFIASDRCVLQRLDLLTEEYAA
jgi:gentisate 1,2-dioxygenase